MQDEVICPYCDGDEYLILDGPNRFKCRDCGERFSVGPRRATRKKKRQIEDNLKRSRAQEKRNARKLRGRRTIGSGNTARDSGDVTTSKPGQVQDGLRIECKTTRQKGFRLTLADLLKIQKECREDEVPVFTVEFVTERGTKHSFYILPEGHALEMLEYWGGRDSD